MQAEAKTSRGDGSVVVQFTITNDMNLGSAIGPNEEWRELLNGIPGEDGPLLNISQTYQWTETMP